jgi:two-component system, OmpR family, response regulator BaeR
MLSSATDTSSIAPKPRDIVIVEDDEKLADMLSNYFEANGFTPHIVMDGALTVSTVERIQPVAILLDVVLPNINGIDICRMLRQFSAVPIIMLTARVEEVDRVIGLEVGADDYVCKPFSPREVLARVHALLRRADGHLLAPVAQSGFSVDDSAQRIHWQQKCLSLTPVEYRLFKQLLSRPGHIFSRERLLDVAHDEWSDATDRTIDSHIKNLRRKLAATGVDAARIEAVYGVGYRLDVARNLTAL